MSVADEDRIETVLEEIEAETGQETYNLPKQREFRVEAKFSVDGPFAEASGENGDRGVEATDGEPATAGIDLSALGPGVEASEASTLTPAERDLVLEIQDGLPLGDAVRRRRRRDRTGDRVGPRDDRSLRPRGRSGASASFPTTTNSATRKTE